MTNFENIKLSGKKTKKILSEIIRKEFDTTPDDQRAYELVLIAQELKLTELSKEMYNDFKISN